MQNIFLLSCVWVCVFGHNTWMEPIERIKRNAIDATITNLEKMTQNVKNEEKKVSDQISVLRVKRDAVGALDIVTNNAQPIHADVKQDGKEASDQFGLNLVLQQPCRKSYKVPSIDLGIVFKVTPPKDVQYEMKSLRKSLPVTNKFDIIRNINRIIAVIVLNISLALEFFPLLKQLYFSITEFIGY